MVPQAGTWNPCGAMRACTFNIRHGRPPERRGPDERRLLASVTALEADVIGLQEVDRRTRRSGGVDQPALLAAATGFDTRFAAAIDHDDGEYGLLLGVRGVITGDEVLHLPGGGEPRIALLGRVRTECDGSQWAVACTHLTTVVEEVPAQLRAVLDGLTHLAGRGPALLLGDLNAGDDVVSDVFGEHGFVTASTGATHPSTAPIRRIDWIAVRRATVDHAVVVDVRASDHRPVLAEVHVDGGAVAPYPSGRDAGDPSGGRGPRW